MFWSWHSCIILQHFRHNCRSCHAPDPCAPVQLGKTGNITRLQQFKRYINLQDRNRNTALCLAQQAEDRDAYALLLKFGASTKVPCHDDNDPICAVIAGEKLKYLRPAFCCSVPEQPPGHIFA